MKKALRFLSIPASIFVGMWLGITMQSAETTYWHNMAYRISHNFEQTVDISAREFGVCMDVVAENLTYQEGTELLLSLDEEMVVQREEYQNIINELETR